MQQFPLETELAGVSVQLLHQTGVAAAAIPLYVSDRQLNVLLPSAVPVGLVQVSVRYNGLSRPEPVKVVRSSAGLFTRNSTGTGPATGTINPATPAFPGQTIVLWATGLGPISVPDMLLPPVGSLNEPVEVLLSGRPVAPGYAGRSGCCSAVDQVQFRIPSDAPPFGCAVPLGLRVQNGIYSNLATIAISPDGGPCSDSHNLPGGAARWGEIELQRLVDGPLTQDRAVATFGTGVPPARFPALGTCASTAPEPTGTLDAGSALTLLGPQGPRVLTRDADGRYTWSGLGASAFLGPGEYAVGDAAVAAAPELSWTMTGVRASGGRVEWSGDAGDFVVITGPSFTCTAAGETGSFSIPRYVLANQPAEFRLAAGAVKQSPFAREGLDAGLIRYVHLTARHIRLGEPELAASPVRLPNGQTILAELAVTAAERSRGLMQRPELAPGRGMLFVFDRPGFYGFWMFQTLIPLDIVWLDAGRRVVFLSANTPPCASENSQNCPLYGGQQQAQYVLEMNAGLAAQYGLRVGDRLEF